MATTASGANDTPPEVTSCRLCEAPVDRDAARCPSWGVKSPWVPDEPSLNPRLTRVAMWVGGVAVLILLLFVSGMLMFGPAAEDRERGHRPSAAATPARAAR
jgi:hypothetical protein